MVKNYIYYRGGMFGDLVFSIVNNGVHLPAWIQTKLKSPDPLTTDFSKFIQSLNLHTVTGCHADPLHWGLTNYQIVCTDSKICQWIVTRFFGMYPKLDKASVLKHYYDVGMHSEIDRRSTEEIQKMLLKKYQSVSHSVLVPDHHCLDISCIFDCTALLQMLSHYFEFDHELARRQYHYWHEREQYFLQQFGQTV
jgi:hypothetical protein